MILISCPNIRLRVRRVDEEYHASQVRQRAEEKQRFAWCVTCGGSVCNNYGYPADTEGLVVGCLPGRRSVVWIHRLPANKVTLSGVLACIDWDLRPLCDERYGTEKQAIAEKKLEELVEQESNKLRHLVLTGRPLS